MFLLLHTWGSNLDTFFVVKYESFNVIEKEINEWVQLQIIQIIIYLDNQTEYEKFHFITRLFTASYFCDKSDIFNYQFSNVKLHLKWKCFFAENNY